MLREGLVDEVSIMIVPSLVGGDRTGSLVDTADILSVDLELLSVQELRGGNVWLRYKVKR